MDDALQALERVDPRKAKIVELKFFGGLSVEETGEILKVSPQNCNARLEDVASLVDDRANSLIVRPAKLATSRNVGRRLGSSDENRPMHSSRSVTASAGAAPSASAFRTRVLDSSPAASDLLGTKDA